MLLNLWGSHCRHMRGVFRGSTSSNHQMYTIETSNSDDIREAVFSMGGTSRRRTVVSREEHSHQEKSISSSRIPIVAKWEYRGMRVRHILQLIWPRCDGQASWLPIVTQRSVPLYLKMRWSRTGRAITLSEVEITASHGFAITIGRRIIYRWAWLPHLFFKPWPLIRLYEWWRETG